MEAFKEFSEKVPIETLEKLKSVVSQLSREKTSIGAFIRVQEALKKLRSAKDKEFEFTPTEDLMLQTLGSQEGAFENIKMQYNGDQGACKYCCCMYAPFFVKR